MILRFLVIVLATATAADAAAQTDPDEIVVMAQVERAGVTLGHDDAGRTTCGLIRSSGDTAIDNALCRRASRCVKRGEIDRAPLEICLAGQRKQLVAAWLRGERQ